MKRFFGYYLHGRGAINLVTKIIKEKTTPKEIRLDSKGNAVVVNWHSLQKFDQKGKEIFKKDFFGFHM